jgi:hypothetical protein
MPIMGSAVDKPALEGLLETDRPTGYSGIIKHYIAINLTNILFFRGSFPVDIPGLLF